MGSKANEASNNNNNNAVITRPTLQHSNCIHAFELHIYIYEHLCAYVSMLRKNVKSMQTNTYIYTYILYAYTYIQLHSKGEIDFASHTAAITS